MDCVGMLVGLVFLATTISVSALPGREGVAQGEGPPSIGDAASASRGAGEGRVPAGFRAKLGTKVEPYTGTGWAKEVVHEQTGIEMMFIPAGTFRMGSPPSDTGSDPDERPVHTVRIAKPFYMAKYEVTNGQYQAFLGSSA